MITRVQQSCLAMLLSLTSVTQAQQSARIEGTVIDSVHAKAAAGVPVLLTRLAPEPATFRSTTTDGKGRFHFDTLVAGRYTIAFATPYLDSLSVSLPPQEVVVTGGQTASVDFATPCGVVVIWTKRGGGPLRNSSTGSPPGKARVP